jgi:putative ABC transport system permease protein
MRAVLRMAVRAALRALRRNKLRSALTMLGIVIGVGAVIAMVSIGQGADAEVQRQIRSLGTNMLVLVPGATTSAGVRSGWGGVSTLTAADARAIASEVPEVAEVAWIKRKIAQVVAAERNWSTLVQGAPPSYFAVRGWPLSAGTSFGQRDEDGAARVAVLGQTVVDQLFAPGEDPLGASIRVEGVGFRVIGVLERIGQNSFGQDQDDVVVIPFSTAERRVIGSEFLGSVDMIFAKTTGLEAVAAGAERIQALLRQRHRIPAGRDDDFTVRDLSDMARASQETSRVMTNLLLSVASISLLVGGIGIMNILLVSVTERTREIGIRMAVGARARDILLQFLVEATALALAGGLVGAALGIAAAALLSALAGWPTLVAPATVAGSVLFAGVVGTFFGYYPARRAARMDPIAALRWE